MFSSVKFVKVLDSACNMVSDRPLQPLISKAETTLEVESLPEEKGAKEIPQFLKNVKSTVLCIDGKGERSSRDQQVGCEESKMLKCVHVCKS